MANYHGTMGVISRQSGKSCVAAIAYRSATKVQDLQTGDTWDYSNKGFVEHVEILYPENSPQWIRDVSEECKSSKQTAIQNLSNIFEAAEKRKDARIYREFEFSLPNELSNEQNIKWATEFVRNIFVSKGMVAVTNFHFDVDKKTGENKPHCHVLLSTRELTDDGFGLKNRGWNQRDLLWEAREQYAAYQNFALKEHGFEARVTHLSYEDRNIDIEGQPKLGGSILDMAKRGLKLDKLENFNAVKLRNQFKILKNPELVLSIVTSNHSTFTRHDIAKVLNRYIDDAFQFQSLHDRLLGSKNLIALEVKEGAEQVYTTREMLNVEMSLVKAAERLEAQTTHRVEPKIVEEVIARHNDKLSQYGGLSSDQDKAIRHMLSGEQIACVVGYAGAGKTTSLEAAKEAWEASGYSVLGLAPTGKAARNIEECGIRAMTLHKFLYAQEQGREQISSKTVVVLDEAGMVDSRRCAEVLSLIEQSGSKIVHMGDNFQLQSVEASPSFRLLTDRVKPAVLETIVRQKEEWQRDATRLFGSQQAHKALALYLENGAFKIIEEKAEGIAVSGTLPLPGEEVNGRQTVDNYCLARKMSGRIWKEMVADYENASGKKFDVTVDFKELSSHQDYKLYETWKEARYRAVGELVENFEVHKAELEGRGIDIKAMGQIVDNHYMAEGDKEASRFLKQIDQTLRQMSYSHVVDTRQGAKEEMVAAWMRDRTAMPDASHIMLAFTIKDTLSLNEKARGLMREEDVIKGQDFTYTTHRIEKDDFDRDIITKEKRTFATGDRILFTSNNTGMGVKNGTLGTILSLDQSKIRVALDGKERCEVSFAPNLYPYIDNGWATNIHKSQGITVDHVKKLASFEEYRNLAYVGMTRHRETLEVFGSSLDFWREEKVIDRLSRVQEKLSGFDYVNADKLEALMKEDARVIWYEQKIQEGKDLWNAIKGTAKSAVDQLLERPRNSITVDPLNSFEHSEEKRSGDLFKATSEALQPDKSESISPSHSIENISETQEKGESFDKKRLFNSLRCWA
jgi:Ti-type conjugative transfer relaxase TraA